MSIEKHSLKAEGKFVIGYFEAMSFMDYNNLLDVTNSLVTRIFTCYGRRASSRMSSSAMRRRTILLM